MVHVRAKVVLVVLVSVFSLVSLGPTTAQDVPGFEPQDDAGSGTDAPDEPGDEVWIEPGVVYQGNISSDLDDAKDYFAFHATASQEVWVEARSFVHGCYGVSDESDARLLFGCSEAGKSSPNSPRAEIPHDGTWFFFYSSSIRPAVEHEPYRFSFNLDAPAPDPLDPVYAGDQDECAGDPGPFPTHGADDDAIDGLVWAALKDGFRAAIAWETEVPEAGEVEFQVSGGPLYTAESDVDRKHLVVLDNLPWSEILCFRVKTTTALGTAVSDWYGLRLENAHRAYDELHDVYTLNLLVVVHTKAIARDALERGLHEFAERLWDATDGHVRPGRIITFYQESEKSYNNFWTCFGSVGMVNPLCNHGYDVLFEDGESPAAWGSTTLDGIRGPTLPIRLNNALIIPPTATATPDQATYDLAVVLLHEIGHYAFGMEHPREQCHQPDTRTSIMNAGKGVFEILPVEFDGPNAMCPGVTDPDSTSWAALRQRYPEVPSRPDGPVPGPHGGRDLVGLHVFSDLPTTASGLPQDDAGSGGDAPDVPFPDLFIEQERSYQGVIAGLPLDLRDFYAFEAKEGDKVTVQWEGGPFVGGSIQDYAGMRVLATGEWTTPWGSDSNAITTTIPEDGLWYVVIETMQWTPGSYMFSITTE